MRTDQARTLGKKVKIGNIDVDAGLCWIGDPCYIFHNDQGMNPALGKTWTEFCDKLGDAYPTMKTFGHRVDPGSEGLGIAVSTGYGDGSYPVYAYLNKEGRVARVMIDFDPEEGHLDDDFIEGED